MFYQHGIVPLDFAILFGREDERITQVMFLGTLIFVI